MPRMREKERC